MNNLKQIVYIGLKKLKTIKALKQLLHEDFQLTGSISLLSYSVNSRKIGDVDIVVPKFKELIKTLLKKEIDFQLFSVSSEHYGDPNDFEHLNDIEFENLDRVQFYINKQKVDAFSMKVQNYKVEKLLFSGNVKVSDPKYSIKAKRQYTTKLLRKNSLTEYQHRTLIKYMKDINNYQNWG